MTTINCSSNCKHQHDGKCALENAFSNAISVSTDCAFFEEKPYKKHMDLIVNRNMND